MKHQDIIMKLISDELAAMTVVNMADGKPIVVNATNESISSEYGSIQAFFEKMFADGVRKICIQERRRNGKDGERYNYKSVGAAFECNFNPEGKVVDQAQSNATTGMPDFSGLNGSFPPGLMGGLMNPQTLYQAMDYNRLKDAYLETLSDNKIKTEKIAQLEREALENKFSDSKAKGNSEMMEGLLKALPMIANMLGKGPTAPTAPGLAQPASDLSESKTAFMNMLNFMDDESADFLIEIAQNFQNADFINEVNELIKKYQNEAA